jgi:hypothetical protein
MTRQASCALGLFLALACKSSGTSTANTTSRASAALEALVSQDEAVLAQCGRAVENCEEHQPDAAPAARCDRLATHCAEVLEHLAEVRSPAVGCWKGVQACEEHAPEQAQCSTDAAACEGLDQGTAEDRAVVIECGEKVEACLTRAVEIPEAAAVACENMSAACDRVAALAKAARDALKDMDDGDTGEDDQGEDDQGSGHAPADAGAGRGRNPNGP